MTTQPIELSQENKRGSQSIQIGQQNNYYGMDYQNTKALCLDLIKNELDIYKDEAEKIARERDEHFLATFFNQLHEEKFDDETIFNEFKNPDMQYSYIEAQKAYIRLGTSELETILSNLLVDRAKEKQRSLLQIALAEALTVVPMLLPEQLDILALSFRLRYTKSLIVNNFDSFFKYLETSIIPHVDDSQIKESLFQHLVYTKAGSIDIAEIGLEKIFAHTYGGLFLSGYTPEELGDFPNKYPDLFTHCLQFPNKLQINAISYEQLTKILDTKDDMPLDDKKYLQEHFEQNLLSEQEINNFICDRMPNCKKLFNYWEKSNIKYLSLTSVGIVLGANRCKQISGDTFNLNIWI